MMLGHQFGVFTAVRIRAARARFGLINGGTAGS
jgi:hypothetical protein